MPKDNDALNNEELEEQKNDASTDTNENSDPEKNTNEEESSDDLAARIAALEAENEKLKANSRKWENRSKSNNKQLEDANNQVKTAEERIAAIEAELNASKARDARLAAAQEVAKETGFAIEAVLQMQGDTTDELKASVEAVKSAMPLYPQVKTGENPTPGALTAEAIRAIKNPKERIRARAENLELFEN